MRFHSRLRVGAARSLSAPVVGLAVLVGVLIGVTLRTSRSQKQATT